MCRTEKTEVLTDELQGLDRHVDNIRETCHVAEKKIRGVLRTEGSENDKKIVSQTYFFKYRYGNGWQ